MIILEVEIPIMGKRYDFQIDEQVPLSEVKKEITDMICRKEQCPLQGNPDRLLVWKPDGTLLGQELSAGECGLRTGDQIVLV